MSDSQPLFTTGQKRQITIVKKSDRHSGGGGHHQHQHARPQSVVEGHGTVAGKRERLRINLKDRKPVSQHASTLAGADDVAMAAAEVVEPAPGGLDLSLADATAARRRIVEVRGRSKREEKLDAARRRAEGPNQASGFDTRGGTRRAAIVTPKNEEKMKAREQLMQIHPHIGQVFRGIDPPDVFQQEPFDRILSAEAPTKEYRRRNLEAKTVVQWGERRLFLYELEFLTQYAVRAGTLVVYAHCAPGTRFPYLAGLFPHVQFLLVDPRPLDFDESTVPNVTVRQEAFSDAIATEIQASAAAENKPLLFIANATADTAAGFIAPDQHEDYTDTAAFSKQAMEDQARWHKLLRPIKSLLKFSLPWTDGSTYYPDGDLVLPVWNGPTSTEMRLIPNEYHRTWNHRHYEGQCFYFNTVTRVSLHEHGVTAEGLDGCYDCTSEVFILERYLERYPHMAGAAIGSQHAVVPQSSAPATVLKLDTTKFRDPAWLAKQAARKAKFLITLVNENEGQPLNEEQMKDAEAQFAANEENAEMAIEDDGTPLATDAAAAAASSQVDAAASSSAAAASPATDAPTAAAAAVSNDSLMEDAAPSVPLTAAQQLKLQVGQFSQELSRRLTNGGTRTLATLNDKMIKRAAFSKKNRR